MNNGLYSLAHILVGVDLECSDIRWIYITERTQDADYKIVQSEN